MKHIYSKKAEQLESVTKEMRQYYQKRTNKHISLVRKYLQKIADIHPQLSDQVKNRMKQHDKSKFQEPEMTPYIYTTWKYKLKDQGKQFSPPKQIQEMMHQATQHHVLNNSHHPEMWCGKKSGVINKQNRDKPLQLIDATKMPDMDIMQMAADWCAVSEQRGNSPISWADKNIGVRWKFTDEQTQLLYDTLKEIWTNS